MKHCKSIIYIIYLAPALVFAQFSEDRWQVLEERKGIEIAAKKVECHDSSNGLFYYNLLLQVKNNTKKRLKVSWKPILWIDGVRTGPEEGKEAKLGLELAAGELISGRCGHSKLCEYQGFINRPAVPQLTKYELGQLRIKEVKP